MIDQENVYEWAISRFGLVATNVDERAARLLEEAVEIAQAAGVKLEIVERIARRTYSRPVSKDIGQEIGGCGITLLAFSEVVGCDFKNEIDREWNRVSTLPKEYWTKKHNEKVVDGTANLSPTGSRIASPYKNCLTCGHDHAYGDACL
jgi:NTP pyrophosphatase (non-canonical NTP hydrolase)